MRGEEYVSNTIDNNEAGLCKTSVDNNVGGQREDREGGGERNGEPDYREKVDAVAIDRRDTR